MANLAFLLAVYDVCSGPFNYAVRGVSPDADNAETASDIHMQIHDDIKYVPRTIRIEVYEGGFNPHYPETREQTESQRGIV